MTHLQCQLITFQSLQYAHYSPGVSPLISLFCMSITKSLRDEYDELVLSAPSLSLPLSSAQTKTTFESAQEQMSKEMIQWVSGWLRQGKWVNVMVHGWVGGWVCAEYRRNVSEQLKMRFLTCWIIVADSTFLTPFDSCTKCWPTIIVDVEVDFLKRVAEPLGFITNQQRIVHSGLDSQENGVCRT